MRSFVEQNRALLRWKFFEDTHSHSLVRMEREREKKPPPQGIRFRLSQYLLNLKVSFVLFYCAKAFLETRRQSVNVVREKKGRGTMDRGSEREDRKRASVCVGDGRER